MERALRFLMIAVVALGLCVPALAQFGEYGAKDGSTVGGPAPLPLAPMGDILDEDFADIFMLEFEGWCFVNNSSPLGINSWFQGNSGVFPSHAGAPNAYIAGNYNASGSPGDISLWLISPEYDLSQIGTFEFYTRTVSGSSWPDRARVHLSTSGSSCDVGTSVNSVGVFTTLLDDINPTTAVGGYPETWEDGYRQYAISATGNGRIAFQYYVNDSGPTGINSNYIGVDSWNFDSGGADDGGDDGGDVPATTVIGLVLLVVAVGGGSAYFLRRKSKN